MLLPSARYQDYWIAECTYLYQDEELTGRALIQAHSEPLAVSALSEFFIQHNYSYARYDRLETVYRYMLSSKQPELALIRQMRQQQIDNEPVMLSKEKSLTHVLPSDNDDILYTPEPLPRRNGSEHFLIMDGSVYQQITGQYIVPALYASGLPWESLFQGETQITLEDSAPYLLHILDNAQGRAFLNRYKTLVMKDCLGLFFSSSLSLTELRHHFRKLTYLRYQYHDKWVFFRFYDANQFVPFIHCLNRRQLANLISDIDAFFVFTAEAPQGQTITFSDQLRCEEKKENLFINQLMHEHYTQTALCNTINKAKKMIETLLWDEIENPEKPLNSFCIQQANQAFLRNITQSKALIYFIAARFLTQHNNNLWEAACLNAKPYSYSQELYTYHAYQYCLTYQGTNL